MNSFKYKSRKSKNYFEGWYVKVIDIDNIISYSVIFGISKCKDDSHCFIQIIDGTCNKSMYFRYDIEDFHYSENEIRISTHSLSINSVKVNLEKLKIDLLFIDKIDIERSLFSPTIMGPFEYLPLECYHEVVFMRSVVKGHIEANGINQKFLGIGYMEKDMGSKFPNKWLWLQCNTFDKKNVSFMASIAEVPLKIKKIQGFFVNLQINNNEYRFSTYNISKVKYIKKKDYNIEILITKRRYKLLLNITQKDFVTLVAPVNGGKMEKEIKESINSEIIVTLFKDNKLIFKDNGKHVGCECLY